MEYCDNCSAMIHDVEKLKKCKCCKWDLCKDCFGEHDSYDLHDCCTSCLTVYQNAKKIVEERSKKE